MIDTQGLRTILLVDDDRLMLNAWRRRLHDRDVFAAETRAEALEEARARRIDLAIVDLRLSGQNGLDVVADLKRLDANMCVVLVSSALSHVEHAHAVKLGARDVIEKEAFDPRLYVDHLEHGTPLETSSCDATLDTGTRNLTMRALSDANWNVAATAAQLGIHRTSLRRRLKKLGWTRPLQLSDPDL